MRNIRLTIRYDGTRYCGWQSQKNGRAIQDVIQDAIRRITGERVNVVGSGRTDAGVHAEAQVASFRAETKIPLKKLRMALNSRLPEDIAVTNIEKAGIKFNAQKSAKSKLYRYTIMNNDYMDPLARHFAAKCFFKLDIGRMRKAARLLKGRHDFKSFRATDGKEKNSIRVVRNINIEKSGDLVYIYIEADGFLYNMARNIAGTLVEVGRGKFAASYVKEILSKRNIRFSGPTMPAKGL
ncbi:MAG: tRNA pseudouridine(38-40) synthase TruA, partial [Candidatus Omnitrophota bacterium]|nr:tRNA pseudouridine(38-40) synthase TruA [Candidatus Omnitrophota bacterium]